MNKFVTSPLTETAMPQTETELASKDVDVALKALSRDLKDTKEKCRGIKDPGFLVRVKEMESLLQHRDKKARGLYEGEMARIVYLRNKKYSQSTITTVHRLALEAYRDSLHESRRLLRAFIQNNQLAS